jgi:ribonuclease BN (tRNA processing enzyme)
MNGFHVLVAGVGDAFSARYYSSCFAVEADGFWLLVDCPHPIRKIFAEASQVSGVPFELSQLGAVVLTHLHADHCSGVEGLGFYYRFVLGRKLPLLAHPEVLQELWPRCLAAGMEWSVLPDGSLERRKLEDFFEPTPLSEGEPTQIGPFELHVRLTQHSVTTTALRLEAAGHCLGYSADTAFDPTLIDWLDSSDLIIHEASGGYLHTELTQLTALPVELTRRMRIIHYPDDLDVATAAIEPLRQGTCFAVEKPRTRRQVTLPRRPQREVSAE